jgi:two-component system NtrC family response regulator
LKNLVERLVLTSQRNLVTSQTLRKELSKSPKEELLIRIGTTIEEAERLLIVRTLRSLGNHREQTAKRLGISVRSLHYKLKRFGLS